MIIPNWDIQGSENTVFAFTICKNDDLGKILPTLPKRMSWLNQHHGTRCVSDLSSLNFSLDIFDKSLLAKHFANEIDEHYKSKLPYADASFTMDKKTACVIKTADCVPILIKNKQNTWVSAIHAGWRGLVAGVIENTLAEYCRVPDHSANDLMAWLGPFICPKHFIVGDDVRDEFLAKNLDASRAFMQSSLSHKWHADLNQLTHLRLNNYGVTNIQSSGYCTYCDSQKFHSYRRDGMQAGRLISLIWLE